MTWTVPELKGMPVFSAGIEIIPPGEAGLGVGSVYLDYLTWDGIAKTVFCRPEGSQLPLPGPGLWRQSWVNAVDQWERWGQSFRLIQNEGRGMITTGMRQWRDYRVSATISPALLTAGGLAVRVQGLLRYYALELTREQTVRLVRFYDGKKDVLAEVPCAWERWQPVKLSLEARGSRLRAWVNDQPVFACEDPGSALYEGALGLVVEEGHLMTNSIEVEPV